MLNDALFDFDFASREPGLSTGKGAGGGFAVAGPDGGAIVVPDAQLLFNADFHRAGQDLVLTGEDGRTFTIYDYFSSERRPSLGTDTGASLAGAIVEALAGPANPGEYAQAAATAATAAPIGRVEKVSGSATVIRNGVSITLNVGDPVLKGDVVQTGRDSTLGISFIDGTAFALSSSARMVLNELVYDPNGTTNSALLSLVEGTISFVAGKVAKTGDMRVETPVATMGIRGTAVLVTIESTNGVVTAKHSVLVEPDGTTGSFNVYDKGTGALIGTVNQAGSWFSVASTGFKEFTSKTQEDIRVEQAVVAQAFSVAQIAQQFVPDAQKSNDTNKGTEAGPSPGANGGTSGANPTPGSDGTQVRPVGDQTPPPVTVIDKTVNPAEPVVTTAASPVNTPPSVENPVVTTVTLEVAPPNVAPTVVALTVQAVDLPGVDAGHVVKVGNLLAGTSDPDGDALSVTTVGIRNGTYGDLSIGSDGQYAYTAKAALDALKAGETGSDTFTYLVTDGQGHSVSNTLTVTVAGANDAPVATADANSAAAEETIVAPTRAQGVLGNDVDPDAGETDTLVVATVQGANGGPVAVAESGSATIVNGIHGHLTIRADGTYSYDADHVTGLVLNEQGSDVFTYTVVDSDGLVSTATLTIAVTGPNSPATISGTTTGEVTEDVAVTGGGGLVVTSATGNTDLASAQSLDGSFQVASDPNVTESDSIPHVTIQGTGEGAYEWYKFTVGSANSRIIVDVDNDGLGDVHLYDPVVRIFNASGIQIAAQDDHGYDPGSITGSTNYFDSFLDYTFAAPGTYYLRLDLYSANPVPAGATFNLHVSLEDAVTGPGGASGGNLTTSGDLFVADPDPGEAAFQTVADGLGSNGYGHFSIDAIGHWTYSAANDQAAVQQLNTGESLSDSFTFTSLDGTAYETVTVTINGADDGPPPNVAPALGGDRAITVAEGGTYTLTHDDLAAFDPDNDATELTYSVAVQNGYFSAGSGTVESFTQAQVDAGEIVYHHDGSQTTDDSFTIGLSDGTNNASGSFTIVVTPVDEAPNFGGSLAISVAEGSDYLILSEDLAAFDPDNTADELIYTVAAQHGSFSAGSASVTSFTQAQVDAGEVAYHHDGSETTDDSFTIVLSDGATTTSGSFTIQVAPVNDGPSFGGDRTFTVAEGGAYTLTHNDLASFDPDNDATELTYSVQTQNGYFTVGSASVTSFTQAQVDAGLVTYHHDGSQTTDDSFTIGLSDGLDGASGSFTIHVVQQDNAPTFGGNLAISVFEGFSYVLSSSDLAASDPDNNADELTYSVSAQHGYFTAGSATVTSFTQAQVDSGEITYHHDGSETTDDSFTIGLSDGATTTNGSFTIDVTPVNDTPVLGGDLAISVGEGGTYTLSRDDLAAFDPDDTADQLIYTVAAQNGSFSAGSASVTSFTQAQVDAGDIVYHHDGSETTDDSFTIVLSDGFDTASGSFAVDITPLNDNPLAVDDSNASFGDVGSTISGNLLTNDSDPDPDDAAALHVTYVVGDAVLQTIEVDGKFGHLSVTTGPGGGAYTYTVGGGATESAFRVLGADESRDEVFTYTVEDGHGGSALADLHIAVQGVNDAPIASDGTFIAQEDEAYVGDLPLAIDIDANDVVVYALSSEFTAASGTVTLSGRTFTYTAASGFTGSDSFEYAVSDGNGGSNTYTMSIDVTPPTATAPHFVSPPVSLSFVESDADLSASGSFSFSAAGAVTTIAASAPLFTQYGATVLGFSSQWSTGSWSAAQALGAPDTTGYGDISSAWAPLPKNGPDPATTVLESLSLGFATPVHSTGAVITESYGNGAVTRIDAIDTDGVAHTVWTGADPTLPGAVRDFHPTWATTSYLTAGLKIYVDINHDQAAWEEIDAVKLEGSPLGATETAALANSLAVDPDGTWQFDLASPDYLPQGAVLTASVDVTASNAIGSDHQTLSVILTGTNDAPLITETGLITGSAASNGIDAVGRLHATDADAVDTQTWTVVDPAGVQPTIQPHAPAYSFRINEFTVTDSANGVSFSDTFGDNLPTVAGPTPFGLSYGVNGALTEAGGFGIMDAAHGASVLGSGGNSGYRGQFVSLLTGLSTGSGTLSRDSDFAVTGDFELTEPDDLQEAYGIRLNDSYDQVGNDRLQLVVRKGGNGEYRVQFRDTDPSSGTTNGIQNVFLNPTNGENEIRLHLNHVANSSDITASFELGVRDSQGQVVWSPTVFFNRAGQIFSGENWTRAQFVAETPEPSQSYITGQYGTLSVSALGAWNYSADNRVATLGVGESAVETFKIRVSDSQGAFDTRDVAITVAGANDAPVAVDDGRGAVAGAASGNVLSNDTDIDAHDHLSVVLVRTGVETGSGSTGTVGSPLQGAYGTLSLNADGTFAYSVTATTVGSNAVDYFTYRVSDGHGAFSAATLSISVPPADSAPIISNASTSTGTLTEDAQQVRASGRFIATDDGAAGSLTWTVGNSIATVGTSVHAASYAFKLDELRITKNGTLFFDDPFSDNNPPFNAPNFANNTPASYDGNGAFLESGGFALLSSAYGADIEGIGTETKFRGQYAELVSNREVGSPNGLRKGSDFTVEGKFSLESLPDDIRENFGIRLTDKHGSASAGEISNPGDDVLDLQVRRDVDGVLRVDLFQKNFVHDRSVLLDGFRLAPLSDEDSIVLRFDHVANSNAIIASFDLLDGTVLDARHTFTIDGALFGFGLDATAADKTVEDWTRAEFFANAPSKSDTFIHGVYGDLSLDQSGAWFYTLDNDRPVTDALALGETVHDIFNATVTDSSSQSAARQIDVTVHGTNDAPLAVNDTVIFSQTFSSSIVIPNEALLFNDEDVDHGAVPHIANTTFAGSSGGYTYTVADEHGAVSASASLVVVGAGSDHLNAQAGGAILIAASGQEETMTGGPDKDVFVVPEASSSGSGSIHIAGFNRDQDAIDLHFLPAAATENNIDNYVRLHDTGPGIEIQYNASGSGNNWIKQAVIDDSTGLGDTFTFIWANHHAAVHVDAILGSP